MNPVFLVVSAAVLGVIVGAVATLAALRTSAPSAAPAPRAREVDGIQDVLALLPGAYVITDRSGDVLKASPLAYSYGLVRATRGDYPRLAHKALMERVALVAKQGTLREDVTQIESSDSQIPRRTLSVRIGSVSAERVVIIADDLTQVTRVEETRRDFVANVSHELKTPVGALRLLAETMEDAADDPDAVRRFAGKMHAESQRLATLVQEIIELSRVQGSQVLADAREVSVDAVIADAVRGHTTVAEARNITLTAAAPSGLTVYGSHSQLTMAVSNLIANAITYSPEGAQVGVSTSVSDGMVDIAVKDDGVGISPEDLERVFERFFRVDKARSRATGGTGLGLSIVKHVAASHGGDVTAWSKEHEGSTFTLRLPLISPDRAGYARATTKKEKA